MGIGSGFQELGRFLDDCERRGGPVECVDVVAVSGTDGGSLRAELELTLSVEQADLGRLCDPRVCADGSVRFALDSTSRLLPVADHDVHVEPTGRGGDDGDAPTARFAATVADGSDGAVADAERSGDPGPVDATGRADPVEGPEGTDEPRTDDGEPTGLTTVSVVEESGVATAGQESAESTPGERDVPPFKDPDLLAEVYDSCETFAEMADALEMDVTAETVRRYMIDFDIHEPNTYQTGDPAEATADDGQVVLSDGIGLPDEVTAEDLIETVERSNTIYEVKQDIDIDRDDALEMLQDLNLLDLVVGRLATEGERDITRQDIVDRLREASAVQ
jgi:hypothetical protein